MRQHHTVELQRYGRWFRIFRKFKNIDSMEAFFTGWIRSDSKILAAYEQITGLLLSAKIEHVT